MVLVDIDAYIEELDDGVYYDDNSSGIEVMPPSTSCRSGGTATATTTPSTSEVASSATAILLVPVVPKTIPLGQRVAMTKKKRKKLPPPSSEVVGGMRTASGTTTTSEPPPRVVVHPMTNASLITNTTTASPNHRHRVKKMAPQKRRTGSFALSSVPTITRNGTNKIGVSISQPTQPLQLPTIEELSMTQSDSESVVSHNDDNLHFPSPPYNKRLTDVTRSSQRPPTIPAIMPLASWEYSSSSSGSNNSHTNSPNNIPTTVVTSKDVVKHATAISFQKHDKVFVVRSLRKSTPSVSFLSVAPQPKSQHDSDTASAADSSTTMTPKHSNLTITRPATTTTNAPVAVPPTIIATSSRSKKLRHANTPLLVPTHSPTTVVGVDAIPMVLVKAVSGASKRTSYDVDIENNRDQYYLENQNIQRSPSMAFVAHDTAPTPPPPSPSRIGCTRLRSPTIIDRTAMNKNARIFCKNNNNNNIENNDGVSSTSSSSSLRTTSNSTKWERFCRFRSLLYVMVVILLACIATLSISVVLHNNKRSTTLTSNVDDTTTNGQPPTTTTNMGNTGFAPTTRQSSIPVASPIDSRTMSPPPQLQQIQTIAPISFPETASPQPPSTFITTSPAVVDVSTSRPTPFAPSSNYTSGGETGEIQYKKRVPILSMNCGGPTLNMTTTRKTVNSNNETSTRNSTLIWESDVYYNTNYYFGSSRIRSKSNEDSCQDYIIPENNTDAVMMMESIDVFNDRNLDALYCTERFFVDGFGGYEIPVDTVGRYYRVELYMMESFHANINERVFDIIIEDDILVANLDIYAEAGGKHKKFSWVHTVYVSDSSLSIYFNASINYPIVNAISIYYLLQE